MIDIKEVNTADYNVTSKSLDTEILGVNEDYKEYMELLKRRLEYVLYLGVGAYNI